MHIISQYYSYAMNDPSLSFTSVSVPRIDIYGPYLSLFLHAYGLQILPLFQYFMCFYYLPLPCSTSYL